MVQRLPAGPLLADLRRQGRVRVQVQVPGLCHSALSVAAVAVPLRLLRPLLQLAGDAARNEDRPDELQVEAVDQVHEAQLLAPALAAVASGGALRFTMMMTTRMMMMRTITAMMLLTAAMTTQSISVTMTTMLQVA